MRKRSLVAVAGLSVAALALTACGSDSDSGSSESPDSGGLEVGVILPDSKSSARWENNDRPALEAAFADLDVNAKIDNAEGSAQTQATQAEQIITDGANVLLIVNLDSGTGAAVIDKAKAQGVTIIDYDRLTLGGRADVLRLASTTQTVGKLQGEGLVKCLTDKGADKPVIAYAERLADRQQRHAVRSGLRLGAQAEVRLRRLRQGPGPVGARTGTTPQAGTIFEQMLDASQRQDRRRARRQRRPRQRGDHRAEEERSSTARCR